MYDRLRARLDAGRQDEGFTLIELLIVIVILGILAGIVVFAVGGITDRGKKSACKADVATVATAAEAYYAKNSSYPATMAAMVPDFLHSAPTATAAVEGYAISLGANGVVTATPACSTL
jgi:general secretion pathway protein G